MRIGTIAGGIGTTTSINLTYLPQYIGFTIGTTPQAIRIQVLGDGITYDLDANGIDQLNGFEVNGLIANSYIFPLADGLVKGKNVTITITNGDAAAFDLYGWSKIQAMNYFVYQTQNILANSGVLFDKFGLLAIATPGALDSFRTTYQSGIVEESFREELNFDVQYFQNPVTGIYLINNLDQIIKSVNIIPSADRVAYLMRFSPISGSIDNAPITRM